MGEFGLSSDAFGQGEEIPRRHAARALGKSILDAEVIQLGSRR